MNAQLDPATLIDAASLRLARRARLFLLAIVLPLLTGGAVIGVLQYHRERERVLDDMTSASETYAISLDSVAKIASDHILGMKTWSERYFARNAAPLHLAHGFFAPRGPDVGRQGYDLDALPQALRPHVGQIVWLGEDPREAVAAPAELRFALDLFSHILPVHEQNTLFQWSYFFGGTRDFLAAYPWMPSRALVEEAGHADLRAAVTSWHTYETYAGGLPANNPARRSYWTKPYMDAAGAGAMVSVAAPVYVGDRFMGTVNADVTLKTLTELLARWPRKTGALWVIDDKGFVLATTDSVPQTAPLALAELAAPGLSAAYLARAATTPGTVVSQDGHSMVLRTVPHAPWRLVYVASDAQVRALLMPQFLPYAAILVLLLLSIGAAVFVFRRQFIEPALRLVVSIRQARRQPGTEVIRLPEPWQVVADILETNQRLSRQLAEQVQALDALNRSKTSLLAAACHDLRQPAHASGLMIDAAIAEYDDPAIQALLQRLRTSNTSLVGMLSTLMDLARLDSGSFDAMQASVRLDGVLDETRLQFELAALRRGLSLRIDESSLAVLSDPYLLRRIVFNLVANAIKYTERGAVHVWVEEREGCVVLNVTDTGVGIRAEHQAMVFEEYTRLDRAGDGLGIGLSVVKRACELLGHRVQLHSTPGVGTTVSITMDVAPVENGGLLGAALPAPPRSAVAVGRRRLVALAEDDADAQRAAAQLLDAWGFDVVSAAKLEPLVEELRRADRSPSLLMSDLHLVGENGFDVIAAIRARPGLEQLPVLMVTGDLDPSTARRAQAMRIALLHKPVPSERLRETIERLLGAEVVD